MHALLVPALLVAIGASPLEGTGDGPYLKHCYVSLIDDIPVPAQEKGLLLSLTTKDGRVVRIEDGQAVKQGNLLARIDDREPRLQKHAAEAELKASRAKAEDDIEVRYSEAAFQVAKAEYDAALAVNRKVPNTVPQTEIRRLELTQHRALLQIDRSKMERTVAELNAEVSSAAVDAADAAIIRRQVTSPVDGMVIAVLKQPGEWVEPGEPVMRVAGMNRLRVEGFVSAADHNPSELVGRSVDVFAELARGQKVKLPGRVTFVSPLVQAGNRYRVRAEVENKEDAGQWLLRPGMNAEMQVHLR